MTDQQPASPGDLLQTWLDHTEDAPPTAVVPLADRTAPLRASHAQQGMWLAQEVAGDDDRALTAPHGYRLTGPLDVDALAAAFGAVLARHEVLRTHFTLEQGQLRQVIAAPSAFALVPEEVADEAELAEMRRAFTREPFDLARDPLLRARLFRLAPDDHVLVAVFHHIANDGWSMDIFHRELAALYAAAVSLPSVTDPDVLADVAELPELAAQYPDYAAWQRALADDEGEHEAALDHWRARLSGAPALLSLPTDRPRPPFRSSIGGRVEHVVPRATSAAVGDLALAQGTTRFAVQFAAFQALLAAWSGQNDLVTGITTANRALPETEPLIGFFVNVLPIRAACTPDEPFADFLARTGRGLIDAYKHDDLPFELLLEKLDLPRSAGHNPLVQVTVASHEELTTPMALPGVTVEHLPPEDLDVQEDLTLYLTSGDQDVRVHLAFRTDLFDRSTIDELGRAYLRLLDSAAAHPSRTLRELTDGTAVPGATRRTGEPVPGTAPETAAGTAPKGPVEELVAEVWSAVLGSGPLHREANFFLCGGTSLAATRVANRLSEETGLRIPVRTIFKHSGLAALAEHLTALIREAAGPPADGPRTAAGPGAGA
ncbi:condensation domain-containing protein [Streptomyces sp. NPDC042319]|uniref:condensation domain-containing protein n=1 Tax=Streptomyces sp. NPDC042319 TaxID=3154332 RepID=UPI003406BBB5